MTEIAFTVVRFVQHFEQVSCMDSELEISTKVSTTLLPRKGVPLRFRRASDRE